VADRGSRPKHPAPAERGSPALDQTPPGKGLDDRHVPRCRSRALRLPPNRSTRRTHRGTLDPPSRSRLDTRDSRMSRQRPGVRIAAWPVAPRPSCDAGARYAARLARPGWEPTVETSPHCARPLLPSDARLTRCPPIQPGGLTRSRQSATCRVFRGAGAGAYAITKFDHRDDCCTCSVRPVMIGWC
jgi:hypothetical protein